MSDIVDRIAGTAATIIVLIILLFVLATLGGADPSEWSGLVSASIEIIVYVTIIGVFAAVILSLINGIGS